MAQPVQFVFGGKAHPDDSAAKEVVRQVFGLKRAPAVAGRAAFLEDHDLPLAAIHSVTDFAKPVATFALAARTMRPF